MKKIIILVIVILGAGFLLFGLETPEESENSEMELPGREIEFVAEEDQEAQEIRVLEDEEEVFSLTIEELNQWTADNWDWFEDPPQVGMREVEPDNFGFFDRAASISPDNSKLIFSVSDYSAATTTSILIVVDLEAEEMQMISTPAKGTIEEYAWDHNSVWIAYTLGTARAGGDYLRVDNLDQMDISFGLTGEDLLEVVDFDEEIVQPEDFMPAFGQLSWSENRIEFQSENPQEESNLSWSVDYGGDDLIIEN